MFQDGHPHLAIYFSDHLDTSKGTLNAWNLAAAYRVPRIHYAHDSNGNLERRQGNAIYRPSRKGKTAALHTAN